jgi:hypothetical protein
MNLAIYTTDFSKEKTLIDSIKKCLSQDYSDIFICTYFLNSGDCSYATLHPFFLTFFDGSVVFVNTKDYFEYKDKIIGSKIIFVNKEDTSILLNKSLFKNCTFLTYDNNQIIKVNNYVI